MRGFTRGTTRSRRTELEPAPSGRIRAHQRAWRETEAEAKAKPCVEEHGKFRAHQRVRRETEAEALPDLGLDDKRGKRREERRGKEKEKKRDALSAWVPTGSLAKLQGFTENDTMGRSSKRTNVQVQHKQRVEEWTGIRRRFVIVKLVAHHVQLHRIDDKRNNPRQEEREK